MAFCIPPHIRVCGEECWAKKGTKTTRPAYRNKKFLFLYVGVSLVKLKTVFLCVTIWYLYVVPYFNKHWLSKKNGLLHIGFFSFDYLILKSSLSIFIIDSLLCHAVLVICKRESEGAICVSFHRAKGEQGHLCRQQER